VLLRLGAVSEKLAVRELACRGPDVRTSDVWAALAAVRSVGVPAGLGLALAVLDKPGAGLSAARSFAARAFADEPVALAPPVFELAGHSAPELVLARPERVAQWPLEPKAFSLPEELRAELQVARLMTLV
jgi:hypothetical protein